MDSILHILVLQGVGNVLLWIGISIALMFTKQIPKFWKKHLSKRKKWVTILGVFYLFGLLAYFETAFSENTFFVLFSLHATVFWLFILWSAKTMWQDHVRIQGAIKRRLAKEGK